MNTCSNNLVIGRAGNDSIDNSDNRDNNYVTINAGAGNDSINNDSDNILFQYKSGDGFDTINGFKANSTLSISAQSAPSSIKSGSDIILTVDNAKITLQGAANLSKVNIVSDLIAVSTINVDKDYYDNHKDNVLIIGNYLNNLILNYNNNVTILGNGGDDNIVNYEGSFVTMDGGAGNDQIGSYNDFNSIQAGSGNDEIENSGENVTIDAGAGNDYISTGGSNVTIDGGAGNDYILNGDHNSTLNGGDGDDTIDNAGMDFSYDVIISGGAGNDSITNTGSNVTISGGVGNDTLWNDNGSNILFQYAKGDGNDIIRGFKADSTLSISAQSAPSSIKSGSDIILTVDNAKITLQGAANLSKVNIVETPVNINNSEKNKTVTTTNVNDTITNTGEKVKINALPGNDSINSNAQYVSIDSGEGNDTIQNNASDAQINGGTGNDSIFISGYYNSIDGGDGSDTIKNYTDSNSALIMGGAGNDSIDSKSNDITISGGDGNDSIFNNNGSNVTINGGTGDDTVFNVSHASVTIDEGAGNDEIRNSGSNVTISGGEGNDSIDNEGTNVLFTYTAGDGNDYISGFNASSTLSISDELYSSQTSGDNVILKVGESNITLAGAATLSTINIIGDEEKEGKYLGTFLSNDSLVGTEFNDTIQNIGDNVIILAQGGNDTIYNAGEKATIDAGKGNDTIRNREDYGSSSSIIGGAGKDSIINERNNEHVTISGDAGNDYIRNLGNYASINSGDGNDYIDSHSSSNKIEGGKGDDFISTEGWYNTLIGGEGNDIIDFHGTNVTIDAGTGDDSININNYTGALTKYTSGDGFDYVTGFNKSSTLSISGDSYTEEKSGNDIILTVGEGAITLTGAAKLSKLNIIGEKKETEQTSIASYEVNNTLITGTEGNDIIVNSGMNVTINALGGNDSIQNNGSGNEVSIDAGSGSDTISNNHAQDVTITAGAGNDNVYNSGNNSTLDGGAGNDTLTNDAAFFSSISGAEGDDLINVTNSTDVTINGGEGNDSIKLDSSSTALIEYNAGDGNDVIEGFNEDSTLEIIDDFSTTKSGNDVIVTVGDGKVTLKGAANLNNLNIGYDDDDYEDDDNSVSFVVMDSKVTYATAGVADYTVRNAYQYNQNFSLLNVSNALNSVVKVTNAQDSAIKTTGLFGTAILSSGNVLEYEKNNVALKSENYGDKITFNQDTTLNYGEIQVELLTGSVISTNGAKEITFDNNSSANITALEGAKINIESGTFSINNLPVNSTSGAGTITVEKDGLSFSGYGAQFVALQVANENYSGNLAQMTVAYNSADESYTIQNTACVKTLSNDFTKLTFDISAAEDYAYYEVNDVEFLISSVADNINVIEAQGGAFKIQGKELDAQKIGRVTIDEQITFSGTKIDFDGVQVNYALNKPAIYSLDGKTISINDAANVTTGDETKTFSCEAGNYTVNGKTFETSADLTFTADTSEIKIPLSDVKTEIYFDGAKVSGISGGEIVFDLANDKITIPTGAELSIISPEEVKLNLVAGNFSIDEKRISIDSELEITASKDDLKIPLSASPVTINDAKITGNGSMTIDNTDALFFSILLPDGAFVENPSSNTFELTGEGSSASFGDENKKVQLTEDGTAYIEFDNEKGIGVGFNTMMFEHVEIEGVDAWTVETSGTSGIDKITGITDGATVSTSTEDIDAGDLRFEVETSGAGEFNIAGEKITTTGDATYVVLGNSDGEIKVAPLGEEYADDDSEEAGNVYEYPTAGTYTVNGITFHATENSKVQTITHGVEFDLSSGTFQYDGLTLSGTGKAQINRYNAKLVSLTDGAKVSGDNYYNRQFEIEGAVELIGKKFESDEQIRCGLINLQETIDNVPITLRGFVVDDKYVQIQDDYYESVTVVDKKISSIDGVKNSAVITGNGLSNITIVTTDSGEFSIHGRTFNISGDSDGAEFVTDSHGNVIEINGLAGSVEGDFTNAISVNGKAIQITGASSIKVTSDGENITEISNVAGDLITSDGNTYRKNVRVYELGGAEKLTTSADGTIIFSGNKFEMSAGKTFTLDEAGNISGIETAQSETANESANVAELDDAQENFATISLSTTDNLEEVFGNFSEGIIVNGVLVKVTDSTNFVVKDDDENVYIETTAADTFNINGKTFTTFADKTIFKLDKSGNVCEIVTDSFLIEGNFSDEIIFNGKKFCVTGTNDTKISLGDKTLLTINLAHNAVEVVESGGAAEIAVSGEGNITVGGKTFTTSDDFVGTLQENSLENFVGTISGKLGELELYRTTITSEDNFSVTGDGEKITAIENLQNGSFACGDLNGLTINGTTLSVDNLDETILTVTDGELKISELVDSANVSNSGGKVNFVIRESGEFFIGEDTFKVTGDDSVTFTADENGKVQEISNLDENASVQTARGGQFVVNGTTLTAKANGTFVGTSDSAKIINARVEEILSSENARKISGDVTLNGGEVVVVENTSAKTKITASTGNNTIVSQGENVSVTFKGGKTEIFALGGKMKVSGYNASTGSGFHTDYDDIFEAVYDGNIVFDNSNGRFTIGSALVIDDDGNNLINFFDTNDELQKVGGAFTDTALNLSKEKTNLVLYADEGSTLTGGSGNDSIFAFEGSYVDAGAGKNYIYLEERSANSDGVIINIIKGNNTIANFSAGFDDSSDVIENSSKYWDNKFDGADIIIKTDGGKAVISNVGGGEEFVKFKQSANGYEYKVALAQKNFVITVDSNDIANVYRGEKSGVDFTGFEDSLLVNLNESAEGKAVDESIYFYGINRVTVGGGLNTLISSSRNETLTSSDGTTEFIFDKDSGRDVIQNFNFDNDKISVGNETITAVNVNSTGGVRMQISGDAVLKLENAQGKNFKINDFVALVDKNLTYNDEANYFVATERNASLTVNEGAQIWLDGSHGKYFSGDIRTLDASTADGKTELAGNDLDNKIFAGQGDASLWGGNLGDDFMQGGVGKNTFFYTTGNGNDTIAGAHDGDVVYLSQVTLNQIASTNITADAVSLNFKDGGSLQINSAADVTYQLADDSKFSANHAQSVWIAK